MAYRERAARTADSRQVELAVCAADVVHFVNRHGWTYDPRDYPSTLPFDLFPRQVDFLRWLAERSRRQEDGLVEKSREVGLTWLCVAHAVHGWLFREGYAVGFGSRKLDLVDKKGDPDCIFEKARFLIDNLPEWVRPPGYCPEKHSGYCKIINPANGATITGEGGDEIGRGGRKTEYFVDEAAFLVRPQLVERSLSETTRCRIDVSTPNGPGNPFANKRFGGKVPVFTFSWRQDPRKDEAWYARQKAAKDPVTVAQEIDLDYTASVEGITIPAAWVRAAVLLPLPESGPVVAGLDVGELGPDRSAVVARRGPVVRVPCDWGRCNTTETAWRARDECVRLGVGELCYDCVGVGAGVRGTFDTAERPLSFATRAVNSGAAPSEDRWPDGKTSKERFLNLRAELWWKLRVRFEKAFEFREQGVAHPPEEMISLPDHPQLVAELSLPLHERTESGKIVIESKRKMRSRGVKSPNFADALVLTEAAGAGDWSGWDPAAGGAAARSLVERVLEEAGG